MQVPTAPIATPDRKVKLAGRTIHVRDDKPTFWARVSAGSWEPGAIAAISAHVRPNDQFLDLGAWVGPTTLLAAMLGADCTAVEADPQALRELRANLAANPELASRVHVIDRAVSPDSSPVEMAARRKPGDSMSSVLLAAARRQTAQPEPDDPEQRAGEASGASHTGDITGAGSDAVWRSAAITPAMLAQNLDPSRDLFIKLDIEGGEFALLPQMQPLLQRPTAPSVATRLLASFHPGILRETGASEPHITAAIATALAPLSGWRAAMITDAGAVAAQPDPAHIASGAQGDAWLFSRS